MKKFTDFNIKKQLLNALLDLNFDSPTPIQETSFSTILGGADFVGIAQTGTGKTIAYLLPILQDLTFSNQLSPRVLILAPTRELVIQIVEQVEKLTAYLSLKTIGVYGGSNNIKRQKIALSGGADIVVGTPRRLYDLSISHAINLKSIKKLVIDEVDIMLDFGYKTQLKNIFELLPTKRQHILFSATMTDYVDELMNQFLVNPVKKTIALSGTPLENIEQLAYQVPNFYTKANLLNHILKDKTAYNKVLIFMATKANADLLAETLNFPNEIAVIHSSKEQNHRTNAITNLANGKIRILIATDVIARGIDVEKISTVISFDTPFYPENYMHRIGRTGRATEHGNAILFYNEKETKQKEDIESLMNYGIPVAKIPKEVAISTERSDDEKEKPLDPEVIYNKKPSIKAGGAFHEKAAKNKKVKPEMKSYAKKLKEKYKKPIRRGDKVQNMEKKNRKK